MMKKLNDNLSIVNDDFPRIAKAINFLWGEKEFYPYMNKLINDSRDGKRQGFKLKISLALMEIVNIHDAEFPNLVPVVKDIWLV